MILGTTPEHVTQLPPKHVFVFGSNLRGVHGAGAALHAAKHFGATRGQGFGLQGAAFAVPTKDHRLQSLDLAHIAAYVKAALAFMEYMPGYVFVWTKVGCGLAGYTPDQMALHTREMFRGSQALLFLPVEFQ